MYCFCRTATGTSSRRPRSSGNGKTEAAAVSSSNEVIVDDVAKLRWIKDQQLNQSHHSYQQIALDDLGASALPSKKASLAASGTWLPFLDCNVGQKICIKNVVA